MISVDPGIIAILILTPMLAVDCWVLYIAHAHTDKLESYLPESKFIKANQNAFSGAGLIGNVVRNGYIVMVLIMPKLASKRGLCNFEEVKLFPLNMKIMLLLSWGSLFLLAIALVIFYIWLKTSAQFVR
jgi:hypothetical protein